MAHKILRERVKHMPRVILRSAGVDRVLGARTKSMEAMR